MMQNGTLRIQSSRPTHPQTHHTRGWTLQGSVQPDHSWLVRNPPLDVASWKRDSLKALAWNFLGKLMVHNVDFDGQIKTGRSKILKHVDASRLLMPFFRAHLVPSFSFGENELFDQVENRKGTLLRWTQERLQGIMGVSLPLFHARGIFQYSFGIVPYRKPISTVGEQTNPTCRSNRVGRCLSSNS